MNASLSQRLESFGLNAADIQRLAAASADPEGFVARLMRLADAARHRGVRPPALWEIETLAPLLACDAPVLRMLGRPRLLHWLSHARTLANERSPASYEREMRSLVGGPSADEDASFDRLLRSFRHREMARIALRDLSRRADLRTTTRELSHLADTLLGAAVAFHDRALAPRFGAPLGSAFCILAMGKLGAGELNYSSDIDVIFVHEEPGQREQAAALARRVIRSLSAQTTQGFAFRVDANLRPYGLDGALSISIDEAERYYERAGQTWERAALLKARACAGGLDLGAELLERLRPFVHRRSMDLAAVEAVAAMKQRIDRSREASVRDDVKLGPGGIREIEFFAQALQLLHAGRQPRLRVRATLDALDALLYAGIIAAADHAALCDAYVFLRDVEHRLQIPGDRQTHQLPPPDDDEARHALARRMGFGSVDAFFGALRTHREAVRSRFAGLLGTAAEASPHAPEVDAALAPEASPESREQALSALGFETPDQAAHALGRLARHTEGAFGARGRERHPGLAERLLDEMARTPAPDQALARFAQLAPPLWDPGSVASLLASNAATARLLLLLFASSDTLSRDFQLHPELLDALVRSDGAALVRTGTSLADEVRDRIARTSDVEASLATLRRIRHEETLRIGLHDLAGRLEPREVGGQLSALARVVCGEVLRLAREETAERYGEPADGRLAVLGLGSLGAEELGYGSDLDLVFVHDAKTPTPGGTRGAVSGAEWATRMSQRFLAHLTMLAAEGTLYAVDARLRPSGSQGTLVTSLEAFAAYHGVGEDRAGVRAAALWERQALLRAGFVAGDAELGAQIDAVLESLALRPPPSGAGAQIADMRRRLDRPAEGGRIFPKNAPGGYLDVEFAVQFLELTHELRIAPTLEALAALRSAGILASDTADIFERGYRLLRRIDSRLRLMYGRGDVFMPSGGPALTHLARQLGYAGHEAGAMLREEVERTLRDVRERFDDLVR